MTSVLARRHVNSIFQQHKNKQNETKIYIYIYNIIIDNIKREEMNLYRTGP